jgi:hypothetical protein
MRPEPLPSELWGRPFLRREARDAGVSEPRIRRHGLIHPTRSLWLPREPESLEERARAMLPLLPADAAFSHETAAALLGLPLPPRLAQTDDLHVITETTTAQRRRPGWVGHRGAESRAIVQPHGLPVVGPVDTWCDLGAYAVGRQRQVSLTDLVLVGDEVLSRVMLARHPFATSDELRSADVVEDARRQLTRVLSARVRPRGKSVLTEALPHLRAGVRSPQESRLRMLAVLSNLPEPEVNATILSDDGQTWLAEGDLVWGRRAAHTKVVAEYQGAYHAERSQRSMDSHRAERLRDHGWIVHEVWAEDINQTDRRWNLVVRLARSLHVPVSQLAPVHWL